MVSFTCYLDTANYENLACSGMHSSKTLFLLTNCHDSGYIVDIEKTLTLFIYKT